MSDFDQIFQKKNRRLNFTTIIIKTLLVITEKVEVFIKKIFIMATFFYYETGLVVVLLL